MGAELKIKLCFSSLRPSVRFTFICAGLFFATNLVSFSLSFLTRGPVRLKLGTKHRAIGVLVYVQMRVVIILTACRILREKLWQC